MDRPLATAYLLPASYHPTTSKAVMTWRNNSLSQHSMTNKPPFLPPTQSPPCTPKWISNMSPPIILDVSEPAPFAMVLPPSKQPFMASKSWCATTFSSLEILLGYTAAHQHSNGHTTCLHVCCPVLCYLWNGTSNPFWIFRCRRSYIDDYLGIWNHHTNAEIDEANWPSLKVSMEAYGSLEWEFIECWKSADFSISLSPSKAKLNIQDQTLWKRAQSQSLHSPTPAPSPRCSTWIDHRYDQMYLPAYYLSMLRTTSTPQL